MKQVMNIWIAGVALLIAVDAYLIAFYAPVEVNQGLVQKIFYWHVPSALAMMIFFLAGGVASAAYLARKNLRIDAVAVSLIEVGFLFCTIVLVTGPLWAKPVWGAFWTWEPRLTSTLFVWVLFFGYFIMRQSFEDKGRARAYSAVLAIFGCLDIPVILMAVKLWRGIHPQVLGSRQNMPDEMWITLGVSMAAVFLLAALISCLRYRKEMHSIRDSSK